MPSLPDTLQRAHFRSFGFFGWGCEGDKLHWTGRCWAHLILFECYSLDLPLLEHLLGMFSLRPTWLCLVIEAPATQAKFHQSSGNCTVINCTFTILYNKCFWLLPQYYGLVQTHKVYYQIRLHCTFIWAAFKSHMVWNNALYVSVPITKILSTIVSTFHSLNCFGYVIYTRKTSMY